MTSSISSNRIATASIRYSLLYSIFLAAIWFTFGCTVSLSAQTENPIDSKEKILADQKRLSEQYELLEKKLFSLYQYEQEQNPERANLLKNAYQQSREQLTLKQFQTAVDLLSQARLREAQSNQQAASEQLRALLELLQSEDRSKRIRDQIKRLQEYHKQVNQILRTQQGIRAQAESQNQSPDKNQAEDQNGGDENPNESRALQEAQNRVTDRTQNLKQQMENERKANAETQNGKPNDGQPKSAGESQEQSNSEQQSSPQDGPADPAEAAEQQLQKASQKMQQAQQDLQKAQQSKSAEAMRQAERDLEQAKRELEKILRQLREEEIQRTLDSLETSFRKMLQAEIRLRDQTKALDNKRAQLSVDEQETQSARLSKKQIQISVDAGQVLLVLEDEGSAVATMEAVRQIHADMQQITRRLAAAKTGQLTQELQVGVIDSLSILVEVFAEAKKDQQDQNQQQQQPPQDGQPGKQALINQLAELKLLRSMQQQILKRHERYSKLVTDPLSDIGHTNDPGLQDALEKLSRRQQKLQQITADIVLGQGN